MALQVKQASLTVHSNYAHKNQRYRLKEYKIFGN